MKISPVHLASILLLLLTVQAPVVAGEAVHGADLAGIVTYADGKPVVGATIAISEAKTGKLRQVATTGRDGHYGVALEAGSYALAIATPDGYAWIANQAVPDSMAWTVLKTNCQRLTGQVDLGDPAVRVRLERQSFDQGDTFMASIDRDNHFFFCLPVGQYKVSLDGNILAQKVTVDLTGPSSLQLTAFKRADIESPPPRSTIARADLAALVDNVRVSKARIIGLGESTHGTSEFYRYREQLTFELIRQLDVRLILFELDALASVALDRYINGSDVDVEKAIADLGFWITDTIEFRKLLADLRTYNQTALHKIHLRGVDVQNTTPPVNVLLADADALAISAEQRDVLRRMDKRGKAVRDLSPAQRSDLDALLVRVGTIRSASESKLVLALAAKSLAIQLRYWGEDSATWYRKNRDLGMAELAQFIVGQSGSRAVLWAHASHISKEFNEPALGRHLADKLGYYAVGFYLYQGSARAWDEASEIGVIPHAIPSAPPYTVEAVLMRAAGTPEIAWVALQRCPPSLASWLRSPRFVREIYATYTGEANTMKLRAVSAGFDALAIVRTGHDSSPSPAGTRTVGH